ncbi:MAG: methyltransferase domain-containing protein, partial [Terriglobia bacterium]
MRTHPVGTCSKPYPAPAAVPAGTRSVLDLGCGSAQITEALDVSEGIFLCGLDLSLDPMLEGISAGRRVRFVQGSGEKLPLKSGSFDYVVSGVALPYMDLPVTLREIRRVLRPGGGLWASLHPMPFAWHDFMRAMRSLSWKNLIFRPYVFLNGFYFHLTGRLFRFPLKRVRCESFQSKRGMAIALHEAGFD